MMNVEHVPVAALTPDPANARRHGDRNLDQIAASLRRFGQQKPIVVDAANVVRAGSGTLAAARSLGWRTIAVVRSDLAGPDLAAYGVADNRTAELAEWDADALSALLAEADVGDCGFTPVELADLGADLPPLADAGPPADLAWPPERWLVSGGSSS